MREDLKVERLLGLSDIARDLGMTRQAVSDFLERKRMPDPDFAGPKGGPLWRRRKVEGWVAKHKRH